MERQEQKKRIGELECFRLEYFLIIERKMAEALKSGKPPESVFVDFSGIKERYLEALGVYGSLGLTSRELYGTRKVWLERPGEKYVFGRVKTVSMFLNRLRRADLVDRKREGREYRYFITINGRKRLHYYENLSKRKMDALRRLDEELKRAALIRSLTDYLLSHANDRV